MGKHPFLVVRMIVDSLFALCFLALFILLARLGNIRALIHGWSSLANVGSVFLPLLISAGFTIDLLQTNRKRHLG